MASQAPANSGWEPQWLCLNKAPSNPGVIQHPGIFHKLVFPIAPAKPCTPATHVLVLMFLLSWCTLDTSPRHSHLYTQCRVCPSVWTLWRGVPLHQGIQTLDGVLTPSPPHPLISVPSHHSPIDSSNMDTQNPPPSFHFFSPIGFCISFLLKKLGPFPSSQMLVLTQSFPG